MEIKIVGFSCPKVSQALVNALAAAAEFEERPDVVWICDTHGIAEMGRTTSPTVVVNERIRVMGRVPSVYELACWIREEVEEEIAA